MKEARDCYTKCVDVTPEIAFQLIKVSFLVVVFSALKLKPQALRAEGVDYVVAPYEADAQLCFLEREGFVDGIITEDSDLLVFGCKTVIFKLEKDGSCISIERSRLATVRDLPMHGWTDVQFRRMAVGADSSPSLLTHQMLSGCDYLPSIPGIGLKKAHRMLRRYKTVEKSLQAIRLEGSHTIPPNYLAAFQQAELAFVYQRVFCPEQKRLVPLTDFPDEGLGHDDEKWIGLDVDVEIARGMALGDVHPATRVPIKDLWPDFCPEPKGQGKPPGLSESKIGTLDKFFTRVKRTKSTPAVQPVGRMASGPSRLSDLPPKNGLSRHASEPSPPRPVGKTSKFFGGKSLPVIDDEPEEKFDLKWEQSEYVESQLQAGPSRTRSPSPEHVRSPSPEIETQHSVRSPSPFVSTCHPTPARLAIVADDEPFTSPFSHISSPAQATPPDSLDRALDRPITDRSEPPSPTPTRILVSASSQMATVGSSTATPLRSVKMRSLTSILVPASSPSICRATSDNALNIVASSDSIGDDDIVTPSPGVLARRRAKRAVEDADDEEREREARARVVADGWRNKYALGAGNSTPTFGRKRASLPLTAAAPRILGAKALNLDSPAPAREAKKISTPKPSQPVKLHTPIATATALPIAAAKATTPITTAPNPHGLSWSALERFRFARR